MKTDPWLLAKETFDWLSARPVPLTWWHEDARGERLRVERRTAELDDVGMHGLDFVTERLVHESDATDLLITHLGDYARVNCYASGYRAECAYGFGESITRDLRALSRIYLALRIYYYALAFASERLDLCERLYADAGTMTFVSRDADWNISGDPITMLQTIFRIDCGKERLLAPLTEHKAKNFNLT